MLIKIKGSNNFSLTNEMKIDLDDENEDDSN
jgi:hypothetical protein